MTALKLPGLPFVLEPEGSPPPGCRVRSGVLTLTAAADTDLFVDPAGTDRVPDAGRFTGLPPAGDFTLAAQVSVEFSSRYDAGVLLLHAAERDWAKRAGITAATATLTLGLVLHGVTSQPYQQTRAATNGPDEVAYLGQPSVSGGPAGAGPPVTGTMLQKQAQTQARQLARAPGVTGISGPFPLAGALVQANGLTAGAEAEGRDEAPAAAVDQPKLTAGSWVRPGARCSARPTSRSPWRAWWPCSPSTPPPDRRSTAAAAAWTTMLDTRHPAALARALGATPRDVAAGLTAAQLWPALPGALFGIPLGLGLFAAADHGGLLIVPPAWWLAVAVLAVLAAVAGLAAVPARIGARRPAARILQAETA